MSVVLAGQIVTITGDCGVEDAEFLITLLQDHPDARVDLSAAGSLHTALWQVLMALSPTVVGEPVDPFIHRWIRPLLTGTPPAT